MHEVNVKRADLLDIIRKNRESHRDEFLKAQQYYRSEVISELDRMLQSARDGKKIIRSITLAEPYDHTADYDRIIKMLELSTDEIIELDSQSFDWYVMDNWNWKGAVAAVNTMYASNCRPL